MSASSPMGADELATIRRSRRPGVVAAAILQAVVAAAVLVLTYVLAFFAIELWESNSVESAFSVAGLVAWIGGIGGLIAGLAAGTAVGLMIGARAKRWNLTRLRWTAAGITFGVCILPVIWLFPFLTLTFPLPFIAAAIAAWRTKDLASRVAT